MMITVAAFPVPEEAHVLKGFLEQQGIVVFLKNEHLVGNAPYFSGITGGVEVQVDVEDFERAVAIVKEVELEAYSPWTKGKCPVCGSTMVEVARTYMKDVSWVMLILTALLFCLPLLFRKPRLHCLHCGNVWCG